VEEIRIRPGGHEQNVFRLEVAVRHVPLVQVVEGRQDLQEEEPGCGKTEWRDEFAEKSPKM
jgi:hypothetical protein